MAGSPKSVPAGDQYKLNNGDCNPVVRCIVFLPYTGRTIPAVGLGTWQGE